ncbi:MAG: hypothetical protein EU547_04830 [Promethearchaeota archaeon]|nr:MAG: hypothetical protein EU547_04830 [Candidatus Lokiarchaeota archaeon]
MIILELHYGPPFNEAAKKPKERLEVKEKIKVKELLLMLEEKYGEEFRENLWNKKDPNDLHERLSVIINGRTFRGDNFLDKELTEDGKVWFTHFFFGG